MNYSMHTFKSLIEDSEMVWENSGLFNPIQASMFLHFVLQSEIQVKQKKIKRQKGDLVKKLIFP